MNNRHWLTRIRSSLLALICAGCIHPGRSHQGRKPSSDEHGKDAPVVYVAFGDSTCLGVGAQKSGGYAKLLYARIRQARPQSQLINLCTAGATTNTVLREQLSRKPEIRPTLITLGVGANDLMSAVDERAFAERFEEIVGRLKSFDATIVVANLPDISLAPAMPKPMREDVRRRVMIFNERIEKIARRHELQFVDLYGMSREVVQARPEFFSTDGFHPSDDGYEFWMELMWPEVEKAIGP